MLDNRGLWELSRRVYKHRRTVALYGLCGLSVAGVVAAFRKPNFRSEAVLMLGSADGGEISQIRSIATQFGIGGAAGRGQGINLDLVATLAKSSAILRPTLAKQLRVSNSTGSITILSELFEESAAVSTISDLAIENYLDKVRARLNVTVDKKSNTFTVSIVTPNSITSKEYIGIIVQDLNDYLFELNLKRTEAERSALEKRIERRMQQVDSSEARLSVFLSKNRRYEESPALRFEHDRLVRTVDLHQQILLTLTQLREQALNSSVKAAPSLTTVEPPVATALPVPRKRLEITLIGLLVGVFVGIVGVAIRVAPDLFKSNPSDSN